MKNLLETAYDAMDEKLASDMVVLDFRNQSPYVDYFIIASARNFRMARSIIENVEDKVSEAGYAIRHSYVDDSKWLLIDLGDVVCHVFYDDAREYYNLEGLWKDLPIIEM
ncbi:MAG: ribosome silencing factor [Erysipelotrichaceae bacterium]|jgi:ribosome-associated protein|nr:ribosome silencing factor [Erysipelotrichaceae bacterium]